MLLGQSASNQKARQLFRNFFFSEDSRSKRAQKCLTQDTTPEIKIFLFPIPQPRQNRPFSGVYNTIFVRWPRLMTLCIDRGHHGGGLERVRMFISAAGAEVSSTAAVGLKFANLAQTPTKFRLVLTATGANLLKCWRSAVARTISYC